MSDTFSFRKVAEEVRKEIWDQTAKKPPKLGIAGMTKSTVDIHTSFRTKNIFPLKNGCFPDDLKAAKVSPIFKKMTT